MNPHDEMILIHNFFFPHSNPISGVSKFTGRESSSDHWQRTIQRQCGWYIDDVINEWWQRRRNGASNADRNTSMAIKSGESIHCNSNGDEDDYLLFAVNVSYLPKKKNACVCANNLFKEMFAVCMRLIAIQSTPAQPIKTKYIQFISINMFSFSASLLCHIWRMG